MSLLKSAIRNPQSGIYWPLAALVLLGLGCPVFAQDPFAAGVRTTPWLKPEEEQKAFKLPPGFEINLVAAEPDIQKPLNMAFDERGRIWLTCSVEYPYAAPLDKPGRDCIKVLEDTEGDGRFEKIHTFADGLNIPIGIYPWKGGCIAWSIPNIWHFEDTDGDGVCDKRTVLYGPFDHTRDVHGNCNAFRRGFDGWVYACHGFNNDSHVKGKDGHEVHLNSGNTFRFKLDGSRIEHFTHGQVNPFGMCFDELFNIFTADCHSKPLTQLIRGGYYPSFGKPHDGLGFVPSMMEHLHGSTAICGVVKYSGENFPKEYHGHFLSGNVMTSRINHNKPEYHGSTIKAIEQPDFLSTTDPWFRPVDLQIGPDGALYILDFYNRIIGHYEVPLPHPGRDRTSGRIWRVTYNGTDEDTSPARKARDLTKLNVKELVGELDHPNLEQRLRAQHWLGDVVLKDFAGTIATPDTPNGLCHLIWLDESHPVHWPMFEPNREARKLPDHKGNLLRTHYIKTHSEKPTLPKGSAARDWLVHGDGFIERAAADALAQHPNPEGDEWSAVLRALYESGVKARNSPEKDDSLARMAIRIAARNWCTRVPNAAWFKSRQYSDSNVQTELDPLLLAVPTAAAADFLFDRLRSDEFVATWRERDQAFEHVAEHGSAGTLERMVEIVPKVTVDWHPERLERQASLVVSIEAGLRKRGVSIPQSLQSLSTDLVKELFKDAKDEVIPWANYPIESLPASESPWVLQQRMSQDGDKASLFFCSLPKGEQRTGIYRSAAFEIPAKLSFWCAGHSGFPGKPLNDGNYVRLRDATTHAVLAESRPPRNDVARRIEWDLSKIAPSPPAPLPRGERGERRGYIELIDGDTANAYAWLAVGRFSLAPLNPSDTARKQQLAAEIVGKLKLTALRPQLAELVAAESTDGAARAAIGAALVSLEPDSRATALVAALNEPAIPTDLRVAIGGTLTRRASEGFLDSLREVMKRAPSRLQTQMAETLAGDAAGSEALLALVESGHASPRLLTSANVTSKLGTLNNAKLDQRVAAATAKLPPVSETLDKLIVERRLAFAKATPNLEKGQAVFTKHCAACHQIAGQGFVVGPQLDGIGNRGLERIIEDVLDPNRNVDVAFRTTTMRLTDGRVASGLFRRAEGTQLVFADNQGKEFTLAKDEIDQETKTALSLMPANVPEIVPAEEFYDLVGYLLSQRK